MTWINRPIYVVERANEMQSGLNLIGQLSCRVLIYRSCKVAIILNHKTCVISMAACAQPQPEKMSSIFLSVCQEYKTQM